MRWLLLAVALLPSLALADTIEGKVVGIADRQDVGLAQVRAGLAWHFKAYEREQTPEERVAYSRAENDARLSRRGLWADDKAVPPEEWRRAKGRQEVETKARQ